MFLISIRNLALSNSAYFEIVKSAMRELFPDEKQEYGDNDFYREMSDGVQNIINIYSYIYYLIEMYYGDIKQKKEFRFSDVKGVILIDELELYLHIGIQEKLVSRLKNDFPSIKILFSTHSPVLIQRTKNVDVFEIQKDEITSIDQNLYFDSIDNIVRLFNLNKYPLEFNDFIVYISSVLEKRTIFSVEEYSNRINNIRDKYRHLNMVINSIALRFIEEAKKCGIKLD